MPPHLPLFIRTHLAAHGATLLLERVARELLSTTSWSWTPPDRRDEVTAAIYARQPRYLRGGVAFDGGLARWEEDAFARPEWPRSGKILIAGAGGGREVRALAQRGYAVRGFEPLGSFAEACARECAAVLDATCVEGSYADLVEAARGGTGRLASLVGAAPFDAILLGWGSLAHVVDPERVEAIFDAARKLGPRAPLLTSFYSWETLGTGRIERFGRALGRLFSALGAPGRRPAGAVFVPQAGFVQTHTAEALEALAARRGYQVAWLSSARPQPWALFIPEPAGTPPPPPR